MNSMIGFAMKSGKVSSGTLAAKTSIIRHRAHLLVLSGDMSEKSKEVLIACCEKQKIPWLVIGNKYELGNSVGKAYRVALTINDSKMAKSIIELVNSEGEKHTGVVEWPKSEFTR
ncbi:L7Ae/L30e/S12e/Gadd45 family ribosomal protein [Syntrophomonas palmitatica]|uniref:L7Ae/L30e/S12e/Gadd45 family ribosomal protein n=1 Tax=Syntrophomonas palmitatica TaxID=402877 RepID=UPI001FA79AC7|nr:ribosomal L7Ae/L30e/S12e/Gadd45 family protein [Syntrophomonas palmitatica]